MLAFLKESLKSRTLAVERLLWVLILLFVFSISFSIAVSGIFLAGCTAVYLYWKLRYNPVFPDIPILVPAIAFAYCILLSVLFSIHPSDSYIDAKDIALFIIIPIIYDSVRNLDDIKVLYGILILAGVCSSAFGLYQFFGTEGNLLDSRITGFMGHWMTFSGLLMILNVLLFSHLLFSKEHPRWFYPAFALLSLSLLLSLTRSAWLGFFAASTVLIAMRKVRWMIAVPVVLLIVFVASVLIFPSGVAKRMSSIFNPNETSNRDRIQMFKSGWQIIKDYPLTGVGSGMIPHVYPRYRAPDSIFRNNQHLHNNLIQIAAENGILTLLAWLWLIFRVLRDLIHWKRNVMNPEEAFMIHGTIGIVISLFVAGMFEYNFGDSEIKMLFLTLITLPYAWHKQTQKQTVTEPEFQPALRSVDFQSANLRNLKVHGR
jgi:O-antigen ligase